MARSLAAAAIAAALFAAPVHAALSGFNDAAVQLRAVFADPRVGAALKELPVTSLKRSDADAYGRIDWELTAGDCVAVARLAPIPPQGLGATDYRVLSVRGGCRRPAP